MFATKSLFVSVLGLVVVFSHHLDFKANLEADLEDYVCRLMPKIDDQNFKLVEIQDYDDNSTKVLVELEKTRESDETINCTFRMGYNLYENSSYEFTFKWAECRPSVAEIDGGNLPLKHIEIRPNSTSAFHVWQLLKTKHEFVNLLAIHRQIKRDENRTIVHDRFTVHYNSQSNNCYDNDNCILIVDNHNNQLRTVSDTCRNYFVDVPL